MVSMLVMSMFVSSAYGQSVPTLGYKILPEKMLENTEGILQVYVLDDGKMIPKKIDQLVVTSSDSSILQILESESDPNGFVTDVHVKAVSPGTAKIALASHGFLSAEFTVQVYTNNNHPTQIFVKTTPNDFPIDGPKKGYVSVEIATVDGLPTKANVDFQVSISTPNLDVISFDSDKLVIKQGEYFAIGEFTIKNSGDALIYADAPGMKRVSNIVHVREAAQPLKVQLYVYPNSINSFTASYAYAIVELQDADGKPVIAHNDIPMSLQFTDPEGVVNTSEKFAAISADSNLMIKEGAYWGYVKLVPKVGLAGTYNVGISTQGYLVRGASLDVVHEEAVNGNGPVTLDTIPILSTGKDELIGVLYLPEDVVADGNLQIGIDSAQANSLVVKDALIEKGTSAALVYGKTGYVKPSSDEPLELYPLTSESPTFIPIMEGPEEDNLGLVVEPLVPKILANKNVPLIAYMLEKEGEATSSTIESDKKENSRIGVTDFTKDTVLSFSANEFVAVDPVIITKGQSYALLDAMATKTGSTTLSANGGGFSSDVNVDVLSSEPAILNMIYPETFLPGTTNKIAIQVLDIQKYPVYANDNIIIKLVSSDSSVIQVPESVVIKKGEYYTSFDAKSGNEGATEIATLATDLSLAKFDLKTSSAIPSVSITSKDFVDPNTAFDLTLTAMYAGTPLSGMNIVWEVQGAEIEDMISTTDANGNAIISLLAKDPSKIDVKATVSSNGFTTSTASKQINILQPLNGETKSDQRMVNTTMNPLFIVIPVAVAAAGGIFFLKKKNMLEGITEKISFAEKFSDVKEKITQLRER
jgi:hypothetical protein